MKLISIIVVGFCCFVVCAFGYGGMLIRRKSKAQPGLRLVRANGLLVRQNKHSGGDEE